MTRLRLLASSLAVAMAGTFGGAALIATNATEAAAVRPPRGGSVTQTVPCGYQDSVDPTVIVSSTCTLTITKFTLVNGVITANGTIVNDVTGVSSPFSAPVTNIDGTSFPAGTSSAVVAQAVGSCQILDLTLGPLDLDLLGLVVHLDTVHLNITAQQGPGNLLGNLLCAVAGLLDNTGGSSLQALLGQITNLLNQILAAL